MGSTDDTLLYDGRVLTGGPSTAGSVLVEGGRVIAVGTRRELLRQRGRGTGLLDLRGALVVPGLIDSHLHLGELVRARAGVDLRGARTRKAFEARLRAWAEGHPDGPILGSGWDQDAFGGGAWPHRRWIDALVPDRPVLLDRVCRHVTVVNSRALERMGWAAGQGDPPGGRVGRDPDGSPNGLLFDRAVEPLAPWREEFLERRAGAVREELERLAALGVTEIGAMSVGPEELELLLRLDRADPLPIGVAAYLHADRWSAAALPRPPSGAPNVAVAGVKAHLDGALGPRTAWLEAPYDDAPLERGLPAPSSEARSAVLSAAADRGLAVALHALGDLAVRAAVELLAGLRPPGGGRIEHASVTPPELLGRLRRSGATVVIQPSFRWSDRWLAARLGAPRARFAHAFRTLLDRGVSLAGSSDAPVESPDPWEGLRAAVRSAPHLRSDETLPARTALELYTRGGARALGRPDLGAIRPGAWADMVVLSVARWPEAIARGGAAVRSVWRHGVGRSVRPPRGARSR